MKTGSEKYNDYRIEWGCDEYSIGFNIYEHGPFGEELFLICSINWEGCSNWSIPDPPIHLCGRYGIDVLHKLMVRCLELAKENLDTFDCEIGGNKG